MTLKLHHLRPAPGAKTAKTRVGRGEGGKGKTAGRGTKGSKARGQVSAGLRGRADAAAHAAAQAQGLHQPEPGRVPGRQPRPDRRRCTPTAARSRPSRSPSAAPYGPGSRSRCSARVTWTAAVQVSAHAFSASARTKIEAAGRHRHRAVRTQPQTCRGDRRSPCARRSSRTHLLESRRPCCPTRPGSPTHGGPLGGPGARRLRQRVPDTGPAQEAAVRAVHHRDLPGRIDGPGTRHQRPQRPELRRPVRRATACSA